MFLESLSFASSLNFALLSLVLFLKRKKTPNRKSNTILAVLLLLMSVYCFLIYFRYSAIDRHALQRLSYYLPIDGLLLLSMTPCLYYYILSVLNKTLVLKPTKVWFHFIAFFPFVWFNISFALLPLKHRIDWFYTDFTTGTWEMTVLNMVLYVQILIYLVVCYRIVNKQLTDSDVISYGNSSFNIRWLKSYLIINLIFICASMPLCFYFGNEHSSIIIGLLAMDIQFLYIFFKRSFQEADKPIIVDELPAKKNRMDLSIAVADDCLHSLIAHIELEKPYLDEDCNIQTVSIQTGIPFHQISNILNVKLQRSFPDFINEYRIQLAKEILLSPKVQANTIEHIATECGFGSKSTFNRAFKKHTNNLTPSEFLRQHETNL